MKMRIAGTVRIAANIVLTQNVFTRTFFYPGGISFFCEKTVCYLEFYSSFNELILTL